MTMNIESRVLGAIGVLNNQKTSWTKNLDADNFDRYRRGMDGCLKYPVHCRPLNGELIIEYQESVVLGSGDDVALAPAVAGG